jgi:glycosyltransferase involved in cell wall biosynthesis
VKVLHVIPSVAAAHGGPSRAMRMIESALASQGIDVETATTDDDGTRHGRIVEASVPEGTGQRRYFPKTTAFYKVSTGLARWLLGHARDYDLIHIHALFSFSSTIAAYAARKAGVPYIVRPLGTLADYGMRNRRRWLKRISVSLVESGILRNAAAVHFTSNMERDEAAALGLDLRGIVIPLAAEAAPRADAEAFLSRFPELRERRWVIFLSRLDPKKNVEALLQAVALAPADASTRWVIAGDGDPAYVRSLHELAGKLGVESQVLWTGHLEGDAKAAALAGARLFVLPSASENFGISVVEALQAGLPVVVGHGVALASAVEEYDAGAAIEPDPQAILEAVQRYLGDEDARALAATNARRLAASEFSMEALGAKLKSLYATILASPDGKLPHAR